MNSHNELPVTSSQPAITEEELIAKYDVSLAPVLTQLLDAINPMNVEQVVLIVNQLKRSEVLDNRKGDVLEKLIDKHDITTIKPLIKLLANTTFAFLDQFNAVEVKILNDVIKTYLSRLKIEEDHAVKLEKQGKLLKIHGNCVDEFIKKMNNESDLEKVYSKFFYHLGETTRIKFWFSLDMEYAASIQHMLNVQLDNMGVHLLSVHNQAIAYNMKVDDIDIDNPLNYLINFRQFVNTFASCHNYALNTLFNSHCHALYFIICKLLKNPEKQPALLKKLNEINPEMSRQEANKIDINVKAEIVNAFEREADVQKAFDLQYKYLLRLNPIIKNKDIDKKIYISTVKEIIRYISSHVDLAFFRKERELPKKLLSRFLSFYQKEITKVLLNRVVVKSLLSGSSVPLLRNLLNELTVGFLLIVLSHLPPDKDKKISKEMRAELSLGRHYAELLCEIVVLDFDVGKKNISIETLLSGKTKEIVMSLLGVKDPNCIDLNRIFDFSFATLCKIDDIILPENLKLQQGVNNKESQAAADKIHQEILEEQEREDLLLGKSLELPKEEPSFIDSSSEVVESVENDDNHSEKNVSPLQHFYQEAYQFIKDKQYDKAIEQYEAGKLVAVSQHHIYDYEQMLIQLADCYKLQADQLLRKLQSVDIDKILNQATFKEVACLYEKARLYAEELKDKLENEVSQNHNLSKERQKQIFDLSCSMTVVLDNIDIQAREANLFLERKITILKEEKNKLFQGLLKAKKRFHEKGVSWKNNPKPNQYFSDLRTYIGENLQVTQTVKAMLTSAHVCFAKTANEFLYIQGKNLLPKIDEEKVNHSDMAVDDETVIDNIINLPLFRNRQLLLLGLPSSKQNFTGSLIAAPAVKTLFKGNVSSSSSTASNGNEGISSGMSKK